MNSSRQNTKSWCTYKITMCFVVFLFSILSPSIASDEHDDHLHHDPFEPIVTTEEAKLLHTAMTLADTDKAAAIEMLKIEELDEASPALDFAIGNLYFQQEQLDAAESAYKDAIAKLPKFRSAIMNLGRVYLLRQQTDKAIVVYQQLVEDGQANADIFLLLGHTLLMENYPVSAEVAYRQSLLLRPRHSDAMLGLAKSLMQQERYDQGLAMIGEILQQNPTQKELWSLRTNAYLAMGNYKRTIQAIEVARRLNCVDTEMLATLGDLYLNQNHPEDALTAYQTAFRTEQPSAVRMLRAFEGFIMTGNLDEADSMLKRLEEIRQAESNQLSVKDKVKFLRLKGELVEQKGQPEQAMSFYQELLKIDPLDARTMLLLAKELLKKGEQEQAVMMCERAARIEGFEADALVLHAQIEVSREDYKKAVELLETAQVFNDRPFVKRYLDQLRRMIK